MNKSELWDQLKAELWRESQGHQDEHRNWHNTPDADQARAMLDRMQSMEVFSVPKNENRGSVMRVSEPSVLAGEVQLWTPDLSSHLQCST